MLKIIPPTTSCGCGYFKTKCAEIHFQTTSFSILCIFCGMKTFHYADFVEHFQKLHFDDFAKTLQCTAEPVVTPIFESKKSHHDPLEFGDREDNEDPDEAMNRLKEECIKAKNVKAERSSNLKEVQHGDNASPTHSEVSQMADLDDYDESDNEFLICKVKVEEADLKAANPLKPTKTRRSAKCKYNKYDNENQEFDEEENYDYLIVNDETEEIEEDNVAHEDEESDAKNINDVEGVDWSKPYEPNLLKNHEKRPYKPRNKPNICTYCGRTFKRRYQLETHLNVHTGEKPHQCDICGRQFRAVTTLTRHLNTHEQRESFNCKFCKKVFTHKVALLSHELRHTQERTVPCNECDKWFYTANQMDTHKRKVHNKNDHDDLPYVCDICSKRYRTGSMLSTHKFKKHYKTAKYSCELCGKKFVDEQQLLKHKHVHIDGYSSLNTLKTSDQTTTK